MATYEKQKVIIETSDQWNIAIYEYKGHEVTKSYPVFLVHGMSSDHQVWDLGIDTTSYAQHLVQQGYHVFAIDLRGRSGSDGPHTGRGVNWSVDDYLLCDLPAAVEYILQSTGKETLHWVGHSLGGLLGFFYQVRHKAANLQSLTTFATALTYTYSTLNLFRVYIDYASALQNFPIGQWWKTLVPLVDFNLPFNRFLWVHDNMTKKAKLAILHKVVHNIGVFEWNQVKTISSREGMPRMTGGNHHEVGDRRIKAPTLMLAGDKDWVCPLDGVEWTVKNIKARHRLRVFGKEYGDQTHYGHIDLLCGIRAPEEVWPTADEFITTLDAGQDPFAS